MDSTSRTMADDAQDAADLHDLAVAVATRLGVDLLEGVVAHDEGDDAERRAAHEPRMPRMRTVIPFGWSTGPPMPPPAAAGRGVAAAVAAVTGAESDRAGAGAAESIRSQT